MVGEHTYWCWWQVLFCPPWVWKAFGHTAGFHACFSGCSSPGTAMLLHFLGQPSAVSSAVTCCVLWFPFTSLRLCLTGDIWNPSWDTKVSLVLLFCSGLRRSNNLTLSSAEIQNFCYAIMFSQLQSLPVALFLWLVLEWKYFGCENKVFSIYRLSQCTVCSDRLYSALMWK